MAVGSAATARCNAARCCCQLWRDAAGLPLSDVHLENLLKLSRMGVTIMPPMPAFYNHPQTVDDIVEHVVARVLDQFALPASFAKRWTGEMRAKVARLGPK